MPKETIGDRSSNVVEVGWNREDVGIRLVTVCPGRRVSETVEVDGDGAPVVASATAESYPFDGWHAELRDRRQINDLIRVLRRARDQVFGADE